MDKTYTANICGQERTVSGFNAKGNLTLADGEEFVITPLDMPPETFQSLTLRQISKLAYSGAEWLLDGRPLKTEWFPELGHRVAINRTKVFTLFDLCRLLGVKYPGPTERDPGRLAKLQQAVVAVAWLQERFVDYPEQRANVTDQEMVSESAICVPAAKGFKSILLTAFHSVGKPAPALPDYFTSYAAAAKYAKVTDRTVKNWRTKGLKVEQQTKGGKVCIARKELDKFISPA